MAAYSRSLSKTRLLFYHRKELFSTTAIQNKQKQQLEDNRNQQNKMNSEDKFGLDLVKKVYELVMKERLLSGHYDKKSKVVEFVPPEELEKCLGGLNIDKEGDANVDDLLEKVVKYSVKTCHSHFYNQLYHGSDPAGLAGQWLSDALNTNNHTFEVAPVFILVERALLEYTIKMIGWKNGDGITAPGGSLANMYGLMLARHEKFPELKRTGMAGITKPLVVFTSEDSHYSVVKSANWMGIGTNHVVKVKTNDNGQMDPQMLKQAIQSCLDQGNIPMAVNATSGTTVLGAYDNLKELSEVCDSFESKVWLHVDACWGGSAMLSPKLKHYLNGIDLVDSVAWNPHKMIGAPLQSNIFVTNRPGLLASCNSASAGYLFQQDKFYDVSYDTGDKSVQCGRKVDAFQVWFMLKTRGEDYFKNAVENAFAQGDYLAEQIRQRDGFELVVDPHQCTNVCFHYIPLSFRQKPRDDEFWKNLSKIPPVIKEKMTRKGSLMIGYQPLPHKKLSNFFRMVIHAIPHPSNLDMDFILDEIEAVGHDL